MSFLAEKVSPYSLSLVILFLTEQLFLAPLLNLVTHRFQDTRVLFLPMHMLSCPFLLIHFQAEGSLNDCKDSRRAEQSSTRLGWHPEESRCQVFSIGAGQGRRGAR